MLSKLKKIVISTSFVFLLAMPASNDYKLRDFGFGTGGDGDTTAGGFSLNVITGEISGEKTIGGNYNLGAGLIFTGQAHVPMAPTFSNPNSYYNKLKLVINPSSNSSDTKFAVAISDDNFVSTKYVQSDNTVGVVLGAEDYQNYSGWGGVAGILIVGLPSNATYEVKVKAMHGKFSETDYGPMAIAATVNPTLFFDVDVSASDLETSAPFAINMGDLIADTVVNSTEKIWVDFSTNGESGGRVYVIGKNGGLVSAATAGYKIDAISGDLASTSNSKGFGVQGFSAIGGSFSIAPLYNQTGDTVGIVDQQVREIFTASGPISGGRGSFLLKVKSSAITPAAEDYSESLTVIASGNF